jgi:hypothetical protein
MKTVLLSVTILLLIVSCKSKKKTDSSGYNVLIDTGAVIKKVDNPPPTTDNQLSIVGKWVVIDGSFSEEMTTEQMNKIIGKATVEFFADGKVAAISVEDTDNGTYTFDQKLNKLTIHSERDETQQFSIEWKDEMLMMTNEEGSMTLKRFAK